MNRQIKILVIEDNPDDAELAIGYLHQAGFQVEWTRAQTEQDYLDQLNDSYDLILSDYNLPQFSGLKALHLMLQQGLDIPFILISGLAGEEVAVECMRQGATDYLLKDRLQRLGQAVDHALMKREKIAAQKVLDQQQEILYTILNIVPIMIMLIDSAGQLVFVNQNLEQATGWNIAALGKQEPLEKIYPDPNNRQLFLDFFSETRGKWSYFQMHRRDGAIIDTMWTNIRLSDGWTIGIGVDISELREAENALEKSESKLFLLYGRLAEAEEDQRRQISRELHDRVGQNLTVLNLNLNAIRTNLSDGHADLVENLLKDTMDLVAETIDDIRDVMAELRPPMLDEFGLLATLEWYAHKFQERSGISTRVIGDENASRLSLATEIALCRITQEALNNILQHAQASQVMIQLTEDDLAIRLMISDNGVGFDLKPVEEQATKASWGLLIMGERAKAIGGVFEIESQPGKGTRLSILVRR